MHSELPRDAILDAVRMRDVLAGLADWKGKIARKPGSRSMAAFHTCSAAGRDLDGLLAFLEDRDKVRIKSGVVYPGGSPACEQ